MVIQTRIFDGEKMKEQIYRNVTANIQIARYREGFLGQQEHSKFGTMWQLKGRERKLLSQFGIMDADDWHLMGYGEFGGKYATL